MSVLEQIQADVKTAMKSGDRERVTALRLIVSELQKAGKAGETDELAVLRRERKRRVEAASTYEDGGREELAVKERAEAELIGGYLPAQLDEEELKAIVREAISESGASSIRDMGAAMKAAMAAVAGRADGARVSGLVKEALSP